MKKYFAKYLPVEGEIKEGVKVLFQGIKIYTVNGQEDFSGHWFLGDEYVNEMLEPEFNGYNERQITPVKLFLCSKDIQVGDKVYWSDPEGLTSQFNTVIESTEDIIFMSEPESSEIEAMPQEVIKIIGEISPQAIWVKEGDEFDESNLLWLINDDFEDEIDRADFNSVVEPAEQDRVMIKCPTCKTFH